jgi:hypothetical protein
MGGMAVECKNGISPSILPIRWHGGIDALIGPSILPYGRRGGRVQEWNKSIHIGVWGGIEVVLLLLFRSFWRMGGMAVACKNGKNTSIMAYGWHADTNVLMDPSILAYGVA